MSGFKKSLYIRSASNTNKTLTKFSKLLFLVSLLTLASLIFGSHKAQAATLNVVSGTDAINNNGQCQLSEAITNINNQTQTFSDCLAGNGTNDTINLSNGTVTLTGDLPSVTSSISVVGQGMNSTIINGDSQYRALMFANPSINVSVSDFKITAFMRSGIMTIAQNVIISRIEVDGTASIVDPSLGGLIGGIYLRGNEVSNASYDVSDVFIHDFNVAAANSIYGFVSTTQSGNTENINIQNVTVARLHNTYNGQYATSNAFSLSIGQLGAPSTGTIFANVKNVTVDEIYSDTSTAIGFGAVSVAQGGTASVGISTKNVTVTRVQGQTLPQILSVAFYTASGAVSNGDISYATIETQNLLLAENLSSGGTSSCGEYDVNGFMNGTGSSNPSLVSLGHNLIDDNTCTTFNQSGDQQNLINLSGTLGDLQLNGGITATRALLAGSPAIGAGASVLGISTDQRGIARPNTPDVGAYQTVQGASTSNPNTFAGISVPSAGLGRQGGGSSNHKLSQYIAMLIVVIFSSLILRRYIKKFTKS